MSGTTCRDMSAPHGEDEASSIPLRPASLDIGQEVAVNINAEYLFGEPASGQKYEADVTLNSKAFEDYYKSFSMKDNCKALSERQNINPTDLSKTKWFKTQIENIIT